MTCNVTGTAISPNGQIKPGAKITFRRAQLDVVSQVGSFVIPDDYIIQTASNGTVDFNILPGVYDATTVAVGGHTVAFRVSVPNEPAADFADLLNASYVEIPPASVTQAQQARDAAIAARDVAVAARDEALLYDGPKVDTFAELASVTPTQLAVGEYIRVIATGAVYQRVSTGGHLDYSGAGGVRLNVIATSNAVSARAFGIIPAPSSQTAPLGINHTAQIQTAIDFSASFGVEILFDGDASYFATGLVLRDGCRLSGAGKTTFMRPSATGHHVVMAQGAVQHVVVKNMAFVGNNVTGEHCFYLQASRKTALAPGEAAHGGLWHCRFEGLIVKNYGGAAMWLRGGAIGTASNPSAPYDYLLPHQWITLKDCEFERLEGSTWPVLMMTGQVEHVSAIGATRFDALSGNTGTNVVISREFDNAGSVRGVDGGGSAVSDIAPIDVNFYNSATQKADLGVWVDRATVVNFYGHWFESLKRGVRADATARVDVSASHFANASSDGAAGGYAIRAGSNCVVSGSGNNIAGSSDKAIVRSFARYIDPNLFVLSGDSASSTTGVTSDINVTGSTVDAQGAASVMLYGSASPVTVTTVTSSLIAGSLLAVRVHSNAVVLASGGNLSNLPNGRLVLRAGDAVVFQRHDLGAALVLVGVNRNMFSATMPTAGYYESGEEVLKPAFTAPSSGAYIVGWRRLTTGSAHVLGTDWQPIIRATAHQRTQNVASTATAIFALPSMLSTFADARLIMVTGTDNTDGNRAFSDLLFVLGNQAVSVLSGLGANTPAARTYTISGNNLMLSMAGGTYSTRAIAQVTPTGDTNFNWV